MNEKKIAVLFPGLGYHTDKPLLYYARALATERDYTIREVRYGEMPQRVKDDPAKMEECVRRGMAYAEEQLADVNWNEYADVLFIAKSIGTAAAAGFAGEKAPATRCVLYTPVAQTFPRVTNPGIVFHGTADPWAETPMVLQGCREHELPCVLTSGGDHSLQTGDALADLTELHRVMTITAGYMDGTLPEITEKI